MADPQRTWTAYLRQELTAPVAALAEYARELAAKAYPVAHAARLAERIRDRADHLLAAVEALTAPNADASADPRSVRHDLRAAASYIVMACEDIAESSPPDTLATLGPDLDRTLTTARRVIDSIEAVVRFSEARDEQPSSVRAMLASLAEERERTERSEPGRILVVDDNEFGRDLIARMLMQQGHTVEVVAGGHEAQQRLTDAERPPIDLILLDVMMPGMTGPDVLRWLKSDSRLWHLPVLMVSALGEDDSVLACIAAGAEDYLTRPVRPELLRARIAGCLEKKRLRDREAEYQARIAGLVRAIFPPAVVTEWEETGTIRPRHHERVGVLFLDIVGFTALCEQYRDQPERVVQLLQQQVERFEITVQRHGVQKVKTIGDGFMGITGLERAEAPVARLSESGQQTPDSVARLSESGHVARLSKSGQLTPDSESQATENPARTLLRCGLDLIADTAGHPAGWSVRVGIHIGPVVTGVLGRTQFAFDVWGHTVNAAARVESHGTPGRVTLSAEAWDSLGGAAIGESRDVVARGIGVMTVWDFEKWVNEG